MIKRLLSATLVLLSIAIMHSYAKTQKKGRNQKERADLEKALLALPDSVFEEVKMEDLLFDEVYLKLASDGWSPKEITTIMRSATRDKKSARLKFGYGEYAKQWMPAYGRQPGGDTLYQFVDTTFNLQMMRSIARAVPDDVLNKTWPKIVYDASDRKNGIRRPGYFRPAEPKPSSGRMHWAALHPEDPDKLYAVPDGAGIFKTDDGGRHWTCITDNIPLRAHRSQSPGYAIPVDPDDWNHVFAFMNNSVVYESCDGGDSWRQIVGATHKGFKRGYCFRDAAGKLKFIGATQGGGWGSHLWISEDTCKTWTDVVIPDELKDVDPHRGVKGLWFQYVEFDPADRNRIYLPTSRSILYFDDGAQATIENGVKKYNIKKMSFEVHNPDGTVAHPADDPDNTSIFPFKANGVGQLAVNPNNPDQMWFGTGSQNPLKSAVYKSDDRGLTWETLHDDSAGIGNEHAFGRETPWTWLGGFGVNFANPNWVYGCAMASAISSDGGRNFSYFGWGQRLTSLQDDGKYYSVSNSRHNADNHFILSHKSGRVFRGSDGGMLMKDLDINNNRWTNIGGDMGQMLFYYAAVNEFGDQAMIGNTQDIDVQTFRYGRWGNWRGYEGSEASFNPYTGSGLYSNGGTFGFDSSLGGFSSWFTRVNKADVVTGSWFMTKQHPQSYYVDLFRIDDIGHSAVKLTPGASTSSLSRGLSKLHDIVLCRDKGHSTIFVVTQANEFMRSEDNGHSFQPLMFNGVPTKFSNTRIAADPDNSDILYLGQKGKVIRYYVNESRYEEVGTGLPNIDCNQIFFHEGSGDLYFINSSSAGIYILENGSDTWRYWLKGFNGGKFGTVSINYTTQEMVFSDYGRGVWVADLEHPSDRYFDNGFALKEYSHNDGRRTIGIDTEWSIPLYYHYHWKINGEDIDNPYQYLTRRLNAGDRVQLRITLRESPDVSSTSAEFIVKDTPSAAMAKEPGQAIYSNGMGRVDLGYTDFFFNDFSIDFWVKPLSDGVLLANRQLQYDTDVKGWVLYIEGGALKFRYAPHNTFSPQTFETEALKETQQTTVTGGAMPMGKWSHVTVTEKRDGQIQLYVNGMLTGSATRILPEHTLNNSVCLSLFGDGLEYSPIEATVDEIKIWDRELSVDEIRHEMFSTNHGDADGLVAHYDFNGGSLTSDRETFAQRGIRSRIRAEVKHSKSLLPICARLASCETMYNADHTFGDGGKNILKLQLPSPSAAPIGVYAFQATQWKDKDDNLDDRYYETAQTGYMIHPFGPAEAADTVSVVFYPGDEGFNPDKRYRLYTADPNDEKLYWQQWGDAKYDASTGGLRIDDALWSEVADKKLLIVSLKPSIEVSVEGLTRDGKLEVFDDAKTSYKLHARTLENLTEPIDMYEIEADSILQPQGGFYFTKGEADGEMKVDLGQLGAFNQTMRTTLRGKRDEKMIPINIDVANRITPRELGNSVGIINGGLVVGNATGYSALHNSNTVTMMGWVRVDSAAVLTGTRPLIFFRSKSPSVASGIHLENGNLRCHWNEEQWSWTSATKLNLTASDLGRWVHLALVVRPDGVDYYLDGMKNTFTRKMNKGRVYSPLMLGQNNQGDTWFSGAFDQVGVWNRSLTQDEVVKYMHQRVLLNDPSLVAYVTMDDYDPDGRLRESLSLGNMKEYGRVTHKAVSIVPFDAEARCDTDTTGTISLSFPEGKQRGAYVTTFRGTPYNFLNRRFQEYVPLNQQYYTIVYKAQGTAEAEDIVTLTYRHPSILAGDLLAIGLRRLGTADPLDNFIPAASTSEGCATFEIPYTLIENASEAMFFMAPSSDKRPVKVEMAFGQGIANGTNLMLDDDQASIPVEVKVISGNDDDVVTLTVKESKYAHPDREQVEMRGGITRFNIGIDREQIDKMGLNPVTINLVGAEAEELGVNVYLEPKVELRLKNGEDPNTIIATSPVTTLDVEAELLEGYLDQEVELATVADISTSMTIGNGTLLLDQPVQIDGMEYYPSSFGGLHEGWNLIGNPYLANINLTKRQNVSFDPEKVTKFVYDCNPVTGNYTAYDMTDFDAAQQIRPFQSYFVQTMDDDAELTITPVAKEASPSKRTIDYYTAEEETVLHLQLMADGKESDRATIRWEDGSSATFVTNEDAPKLWSLKPAANQLYSLTSDKTATSINTTPADTKEVSVGLKTGTPGEFELRATGISGFGENQTVQLIDNTNSAKLTLEPGAGGYTFRADEPGQLDNRFSIKVTSNPPTGIGQGMSDGGYRVYTDTGTCTVTGLKGNAIISIYAPDGKLLRREHTGAERFTTDLAPGSYVLKIRENGKDYVTKIVVK